jgi:hypothetical protein
MGWSGGGVVVERKEASTAAFIAITAVDPGLVISPARCGALLDAVGGRTPERGCRDL